MFSVVVPTYNRPDTLQKLLQSLELQTISKTLFEVIVVFTDGDTSQNTLNSFRPTFPLVSLKIEDPIFFGKSASLKRNKGFQTAKYPWIAFIDDDCIADCNWLKNAIDCITSHNPSAIEGLTQIPIESEQTFTAKGLRHLSRFGGYQTCNMLYKKEVLTLIGGFDPQLPFYLEDTDLAWSVLEKNLTIIPAENVIVTHPVPPPNVYRWIENAQRTRLIPYLAKKHPTLFKKMKFRALARSHWLLLALCVILTSAFFLGAIPLLFTVLFYFMVSSIYVLYVTRDCQTKFKELFQMLLIFPFVPPIAAIQLLRGNIEQRTVIF